MFKVIKIFFLILFGILFIIVIYKYFIIEKFEVKKYAKNNLFDLSTVLPISEKGVIYLNEIYDNKEFIGFDCIKDSSYYVKIYKIGNTKSSTIIELVENVHEPLSVSFNIYQFSFFPPNTKAKLQESYNVEALQNNDIKKIRFNVVGKVLNKKIVNSNLVVYEIIASKLSFALNENPNEIFDMIGIESKNQILFTKDKNNNVYFGYITNLPNNETLELKNWLR